MRFLVNNGLYNSEHIYPTMHKRMCAACHTELICQEEHHANDMAFCSKECASFATDIRCLRTEDDVGDDIGMDIDFWGVHVHIQQPTSVQTTTSRRSGSKPTQTSHRTIVSPRDAHLCMCGVSYVVSSAMHCLNKRQRIKTV